MTDPRELDLLVDLAKLLKKYGPEPFEILARSISSPEMAQRLVALLIGTASIARATPQRKRGAAIPVRDSLSALKGSDPEKYKLLTDFHQGLLAKTLLPTLRELRDFARDCELPEIRGSSRQKSISPLIKSLISLPTEELKEKFQALRRHDKDDRSLRGWSNLILDKERRLRE